MLSVLTALCPGAFGLNPALDINQYEHKAWTVREGFFKGAIYAIAQTPHGYLWLSTALGLERFDGIRMSNGNRRNPASPWRAYSELAGRAGRPALDWNR